MLKRRNITPYLQNGFINAALLSLLTLTGCEKTETALQEDNAPIQAITKEQKIVPTIAKPEPRSTDASPIANAPLPAAHTPHAIPVKAATSAPKPQQITRRNPKAGFPVQRCMNLGNALEAEHEGAWGYTIRRKDFRIVKQAGFDTVRIPVRWSNHAQNRAPYTIDAAFMTRVQSLVAQAQAQGLGVILDIHHYDEMMDHPARHEARFLGLWDQIAKAFANAPDTVYFELINEPKANMSARKMNALYAKALPIIRRTNPTRKIIIGGNPWNSLEGMANVVWPKDKNIIATFHYYGPHEFTHQGAPWENPPKPMGVRWGGRKDMADLRDAYAYAKDFSTQTGLHVFVGEFGVINTVPLPQRNAWMKAQRKAMEANGFSWCAWDYSGAFNSYDIQTERWLPGVLDALTGR